MIGSADGPARPSSRNSPTAWLPTTAPALDPLRRDRSLPVGGGARGAAGGGDQPRRAPRHAAELPAGGDREPRGARARATAASCPSRRSPTSGEALRRELRRFDRVGRPSDGELLVRAARRRRPARRDRRQARARRACARSRSKPTACAGRCACRSGSRPGGRTSAARSCCARTAARRAHARRRKALGARLATELAPPRSHRHAARPMVHNLARCSPDQSCGCCG